MARTRHKIERDDKVAEITTVARRQLLEGGYGALSVAAIARELGVAQNAIYWYFPSRDHLFVAALRDLMAEFPIGKPRAGTVSDRAVWIVNRIAEWHPLVVALRERASGSEVVAEFNREVEAIVRSMVGRVLADHVAPGELDVAADAFWAAIEGVLLRQLSRRRREAVVRFTLDRFIGAAAAAPAHD